MARQGWFYTITMAGGTVNGKKPTKPSDVFALGIDEDVKKEPKVLKIAKVTKVDG